MVNILISKFLPTFLITFFGLIFLFFIHPIGGDGDFYHHLNTGKYVIENRKLPQIDEFTYTAKGKEWVGYAWGMGSLFYLTFSTFGYVGISLLVASIALLTFVLLYFVLRSYLIKPMPAILALSMAAPVLAIRWPNRPEIVTYPFIAGVLLIERLRNNRPNLVFLYPVLILIWANLYGSSVFIGLGLILIFVIKQLIKDKSKIKNTEKKFYFFSLITLPISLINGCGFKTVFYILLIPQISHIQSEWGGIFRNLGGPLEYVLIFQYWLIIYLIFFDFLILLLIVSFKKIKTNLFLVFLSAGVLIPFFIFRHLPLGVIFSLPLLGVLINNFWSGKFKKSFLVFICLCLVFVMVRLSIWTLPRGFGVDNDPYSPRLINFLKENQLTGRAFNNQQIGGFLTFNLYPKVLVFTDTRDDLYLETDVLKDFYDNFAFGNDVSPLISKYQSDFVVGDLADGAVYRSLFYSELWKVVFIDGHYFVAIPTELAKSKRLKSLDNIDPFLNTGAKPGKEKAALEEYRMIFKDLDSANNKLRLAEALIANKKFEEVIDLLLDAKLEGGPKAIMFAIERDYLLAQAYFALGDCFKAKLFIDKTDIEAKNKFIFSPNLEIPSGVNKGYAFYYPICEKNRDLGKYYLDKYLSSPDVEPEERDITQKQFESLF